MKHAVSTLEGALLDAAVALADGRLILDDEPGWPKGDYRRLREEFGGEHVVRWYARNDGEGEETDEIGGWEPLSNWGSPSTDWSHGGPLIERERIDLGADHVRKQPLWYAAMLRSRSVLNREYGPTPLIAAMRAYVVAKLGDEVEL